MNSYYPELEESTEVVTKKRLKEPPMYKVLLYNDNYTSMDFVVYILESVFNKSTEEAVNVMLQIHNDGVGVCGVYPAEIAETKVTTVHNTAREHEFPLKCSMEEK
ncbi:specificity factor for ClpA-ClpP chaperone-protease complex [Candidatus Magnetomoraceae bacterium gMMP-1]